MCVRAERRLIKIRRMEGDACHLFLESFAYVSFALGVCIFGGIFFLQFCSFQLGSSLARRCFGAAETPINFFVFFFREEVLFAATCNFVAPTWRRLDASDYCLTRPVVIKNELIWIIIMWLFAYIRGVHSSISFLSANWQVKTIEVNCVCAFAYFGSPGGGEGGGGCWNATSVQYKNGPIDGVTDDVNTPKWRAFVGSEPIRIF